MSGFDTAGVFYSDNFNGDSGTNDEGGYDR